jgi:hypothetical protein
MREDESKCILGISNAAIGEVAQRRRESGEEVEAVLRWASIFTGYGQESS